MAFASLARVLNRMPLRQHVSNVADVCQGPGLLKAQPTLCYSLLQVVSWCQEHVKQQWVRKEAAAMAGVQQ